MGLELLSDADLNALKGGDLSKLSDAGLAELAGGRAPVPQGAPERSTLQTAGDLLKYTGKTLMGGPLGQLGTKINDGVQGLIDRAAYTAGGKVTDTAMGLGTSPETAAGLGRAANVGVQAVPVVAGMGLGRLAAPAVERGARFLMQSAVKPTPTDLLKGKADKAITTMLDKGISPTREAMDATKSKIAGLSDDVAAILKTHANATIDKSAIANSLNPVIAKIENTSLTPNAARRAVEDIYDEVLVNPSMPRNIPVEQAQKIKQAIYKALGDRKYSLMPYSPTELAQTSGNKAMARNIKEQIEAIAPEVKPINAKQSELINVVKVAERRALTEGNADPLAMALLHDPKSMALYLAQKYGASKALMARGMYQGRNVVPGTVGALGGAGYSAYTNGALSEPKTRGVLSK